MLINQSLESCQQLSWNPVLTITAFHIKPTANSHSRGAEVKGQSCCASVVVLQLKLNFLRGARSAERNTEELSHSERGFSAHTENWVDSDISTGVRSSFHDWWGRKDEWTEGGLTTGAALAERNTVRRVGSGPWPAAVRAVDPFEVLSCSTELLSLVLFKKDSRRRSLDESGGLELDWGLGG